MNRIETVLDKLSDRYLIALVKERQYVDKLTSYGDIPQVYLKRHIPKSACLDLIWKDIIEQAYHQFVENLAGADFKGWCINLEEDNSDSTIRTKKKKLQDELMKLGLHQFAPQNHLSRKLLRSTLSSLGLETESNDAAELVGLLFQEIVNMGLEYILLQLSMKLLNDMVKDLSLQIKSTSKKLVVRYFMAMQDYVPASRKTISSPTKSQSKTSPTKKRKLRPEDLELIFESDDSVDWDPNKNIEEDISIAEEDDGDKDPKSDSEMDEESSDEDYDDGDRKRKKKRKKTHSSSSKSSRRHKREKYASESEESY